MSDNPLLHPWSTPFGIPPFEQLTTADFRPAFDRALQSHWQEVDRIATQSAAASFDNTLLALERAGTSLQRVQLLFHNLAAAHTDAQLQALEREMAPRLAAHESRILLDERLFGRIDALYQRRLALGLDPQSLRLLERYHLDFRLAGAHLPAVQRQRLAAIAEALALAYTRFSQNVLVDENSFTLVLSQDDELQGLPDFVRTTARAAAIARGHDGPNAHVITLSRSSLMPFMTFSENRALRERLWKAWCARGQRLPEHDNRPLIHQILQLRLEQARLLGYRHSADKALADTMAGNPQAVRELLLTVWEPARRRARQEYEDMLSLARERQPQPAPERLEAWDWHYWAEQVRQQRHDLQESQIKPYLQLHRLTEAMFHVAHALFGLRFVPLTQAPRYTPQLQLWEVRDEHDQHVGVFMSDNFARSNKRSGAWMSVYRGQSDLDRSIRPLVVNHNNFAAPADGEPALLSLDDARTLFHEFGHGLHGLLSQCRYPRLSGTQVLRDFVEFPSQILENWLLQPDILQRFATHHLTGEPMPQALIDKVLQASRFNQGFATVEYVASALVDLALHECTELDALDPEAFEQALLQQIGMPPAIGPRHRLPHFLHLFAGDSYASAYYVYLWAEVLEADGFAAFMARGNLFDPELARRLKMHIFTQGNAVPPMQAFEAFLGRPPQIGPLLEQRGLATV